MFFAYNKAASLFLYNASTSQATKARARSRSKNSRFSALRCQHLRRAISYLAARLRTPSGQIPEARLTPGEKFLREKMKTILLTIKENTSVFFKSSLIKCGTDPILDSQMQLSARTLRKKGYVLRCTTSSNDTDIRWARTRVRYAPASLRCV